MDFILDLPVIGLLLQFIGYVVTVTIQNSALIVTVATPIGIGALCGFMNERSGVVNIGIEGMMIASAFAAWWVAALAAQALPGAAGPLGITLPLLVGLLAALAVGVLVSAVHAWLSISVRADQIISGTIINIVGLGITGYLALLISQNSPATAGNFDRVRLPAGVGDIPLLGWLLRTFVEHGPITLSMLVLVVVLQVLLYRSRWGLRTRAAGEHPRAAETVGIDVIRVRYRNVILGGIFAGLAGAYLTLEQSGSFQNGMTSGRGFIAIAAVIVGRWTPLGAFGAALLFTASDALRVAVGLSPPTGQLGDIVARIPNEFYSAFPFVVTIVVLVLAAGRSVAPAAVGKPYTREART